MKLNSLTLRLTAAAILWSVILLLVGGVLLTFQFDAYVQRNFDSRLQSYLFEIIAETASEDGETSPKPELEDQRFSRTFSGWYWQIDATDGPLFQSDSLWDQSLSVPPQASSESNEAAIAGPLGQQLRFVSRTIQPPGSPLPLVFTVAVNEAEIAAEAERFSDALTASFQTLGQWLIGFIIIGFALFIVFVQRFGMRPLRRLGDAMNQIRTGRTRRLTGNFPSEIAPLARELNALLDSNEAVVERARAHAGDLAHMIKTPLSVLMNEAEKEDSPLAEKVMRHAKSMRGQVDHQLARASTAAAANLIGVRAQVGPVVAELVRTLETIYSGRDLTFSQAGDLSAHFRGEKEDLQEMIGNLMENACKWAKTKIELNVTRHGDRLKIAIEDDGPGLTAEECIEVLKRGMRLDEAVPGTGLGLAIVVDIARLYSGDIVLGAGAHGGLKAELDLPAAD